MSTGNFIKDKFRIALNGLSYPHRHFIKYNDDREQFNNWLTGNPNDVPSIDVFKD